MMSRPAITVVPCLLLSLMTRLSFRCLKVTRITDMVFLMTPLWVETTVLVRRWCSTMVVTLGVQVRQPTWVLIILTLVTVKCLPSARLSRLPTVLSPECSANLLLPILPPLQVQ